MLQVPKLDDLDYAKLFERARGMIPTMTQEWTDFNAHDPGITTLQTFAWLYDTMNYYLSATGEVHRLKYLKLLGIYPKHAAARCNIALDAPSGTELLLPKGTKLHAGDLVFETEKTYKGAANRLLAIYNEVEGKKNDMTRFAGEDGDFARIFSLKKGVEEAVYFGFELPFERDADFFVEVAPSSRNLFDGAFSLSKTEWDYFNGDEWKKVQSVEDETCGFLRSGFVHLGFEGATAEFEDEELSKANYLRCRLLENQYDVLPKIGRVRANCVGAVQMNTYAEALEIVCDGSDEIPIDYYIKENARISVAAEEEEAYKAMLVEGWSGRCTIGQGGEFWQKTIKFKPGFAPKAGEKILVSILDPMLEDDVQLGFTDGTSNQEMEFLAENVEDIRLALTYEKKGQKYIELWDLCEELQNAGFDDRCFVFSAEEHSVMFGDGIHGRQPEPGMMVTAIVVRTSALEGGNVLADRITGFEDGDFNFNITNPAPAVGGCRSRSSAELENEVEAKLRRVTRAVTADDYKALVLSAPGLMIDSVAVIPMKEYCKYYNVTFTPNTVMVAVKPAADEDYPVLSETYRKLIAEHLEKYRILSTEIRIIPAQYNGIGVYCRIHLRDNTQAARAEIESCIRKITDTVSSGEFGKKVDYGRLFSALEMLDCVKSVSQLSLEYIGAGAGKNDNGDVVVFPDSLTYLHELGIEYV